MSLATHPRVAPELERIERDFAEYGPVEIRAEGGELLVSFTAPSYGWTPGEGVRVLIKVPPLYPEQRPDLLFVQHDARSPGGNIPNTMKPEVPLLDRKWAQVSWHLTGNYDPTQMNLLGFARSAMLYLQRTSR